MKPSHGSESFEPSEAPKTSKSRKPETGPFILEDDDEDVEPVAMIQNDSAPLDTPTVLSQGRPKGLREISPNTSQQRVEHNVELNDPDAGDEKPVTITTENGDTSARHSPVKENDPAPIQQATKLNHELAEILKRQSVSSNSNPTAPTKRKSRPLGRNVSSISNRSGSMATAPSIPSDVFEENSAADGFDYSKAVPAQPPSTQLGYDTPEAEAHRRQMSEKMGTDMLQDDGVGKRVASVGTVKDSSSRPAVGGRTKGRSRAKP